MRISKRGRINEGRKMIFETKKKLQYLIDCYFERIKEENKAPTMTGLALALEIDRKTLVNYEKRDEFFHTIKTARQRVEEYNEEKLISGTPATGLIFNLKNNFGWKDLTQQEVQSNQNIVYIEKKEKDEYEKHIEKELDGD
jgi:hypothetical protein